MWRVALVVLVVGGCVFELEEGSSEAELGSGPAWQTVFADEFSGTRLNRDRWDTRFFWGEQFLPANQERQCYLEDQVVVSGGQLRLIAERRPATCQGVRQPFRSGMVAAHDGMAQRYGYFEMRARMPAGDALWPAFWTLPNERDDREEIDIVEVLGDDPQRAYMNYHWENGRGENQSQSTSFDVPGPSLAAGFHTYAVRWTPDDIRWFVDGVQRKRFHLGAAPAHAYLPDQQHYLIANLAVGGHWPGEPTADTPDRAVMRIDYIRAARRLRPGANNPNRVRNGGFENGLRHWSQNGDVRIGGQSAAGEWSAHLRGQAGVEQRITGLRPFTVYEVSARLRAGAGAHVMVGVRTFGRGSTQLTHGSSVRSSYRTRRLTFMTGDSDEVTLFVYQTRGRRSFVDRVKLRVAD